MKGKENQDCTLEMKGFRVRDRDQTKAVLAGQQ